uniref:Uncharacterized protein n=1 Tax=Anser cygnoides TaxID=8845 RepID=A0A8B9IJE5_ANSCY
DCKGRLAVVFQDVSTPLQSPPSASTTCPLEPVDLGVSEQRTLPEQPPSSPELGEDEEATSPPDPDVPYPDLAPVVFFCLKQTTSPRNWCIKMVCNPYPFQAASPPVSPPWEEVEEMMNHQRGWSEILHKPFSGQKSHVVVFFSPGNFLAPS